MFYSIHEIVLAWKEGLLTTDEAKAAVMALINPARV